MVGAYGPGPQKMTIIPQIGLRAYTYCVAGGCLTACHVVLSAIVHPEGRIRTG